jgi:hypothetical protein
MTIWKGKLKPKNFLYIPCTHPPIPLLYSIKKGEYIAVYQILSPSLRSREGEYLNVVKEGGEFMNTNN